MNQESIECHAQVEFFAYDDLEWRRVRVDREMSGFLGEACSCSCFAKCE